MLESASESVLPLGSHLRTHHTDLQDMCTSFAIDAYECVSLGTPGLG